MFDRKYIMQLRLGGHGAAAFALWWLEEGSNNGFHFDLAGLTFQVLLNLFLKILTRGCRRFPPR